VGQSDGGWGTLSGLVPVTSAARVQASVTCGQTTTVCGLGCGGWGTVSAVSIQHIKEWMHEGRVRTDVSTVSCLGCIGQRGGSRESEIRISQLPILRRLIQMGLGNSEMLLQGPTSVAAHPPRR
jgi:hypothetical protein